MYVLSRLLLCQGLEETIASLRAQIGSLQQRCAILQEEIDYRDSKFAFAQPQHSRLPATLNQFMELGDNPSLVSSSVGGEPLVA